MSKAKRDAALRGLDRLIESARRNGDDRLVKNWAFGYAQALHSLNIIDYFEVEEILKERGAW